MLYAAYLILLAVYRPHITRASTWSEWWCLMFVPVFLFLMFLHWFDVFGSQDRHVFNTLIIFAWVIILGFFAVIVIEYLVFTVLYGYLKKRDTYNEKEYFDDGEHSFDGDDNSSDGGSDSDAGNKFSNTTIQFPTHH